MSWLRRVSGGLGVGVTGLCLAVTPAAGNPRAFVVGNNRGLGNESELKFAQGDAHRVAQALTEVGTVAQPELTTLLGKDLETVARAFSEFTRAARPDDLTIVFLSGHGSQRGLHIDGRIWPWEEIRRAVLNSPAQVVVVLVDACQSGALLSPKGFGRATRSAIKTTTFSPGGRIMIASSGATELSHESTLLQGSPFALSLVSGLRGAADGNGDGRITVAELYAYIYQRALADTLNAPSGPQHATQEWRLFGAGQVVLAETRAARAQVRLGAGRFGQCFVLDARETSVLGELGPGSAGVALPPGDYGVKCLANATLYVGRLRLGSGEVRLESLQLEPVPYQVALAKGEDQVWRSEYSLGLGLAAEGGEPVRPMATLGWHTGPRGGGLDFRLGGGTRRATAGDSPGFWLAAITGLDVAVPWWRALGSSLSIGIQAGLEDRFAAADHRAAALVGPYVGFGWSASPSMAVFSRLDLLTSVSLTEANSVSFATLATAGLVLGEREPP